MTLSYRREAHLANGNCVVNKLLPEQFFYISVIETITALFQVQEFARKYFILEVFPSLRETVWLLTKFSACLRISAMIIIVLIVTAQEIVGETVPTLDTAPC